MATRSRFLTRASGSTRSGIDAPESGQAFGQVSKQNLSSLVFGRDVVVVWSKVDRYGRLVGTVIRGEVNTNLEQIRARLAWYFRQYAADVAPEHRPVYAAAEVGARSAKVGLWRDVSPKPPWEFRHPEPSLAAATALLSAPPATTLAASPAAGPVIANKNSRIYHVPGCPNYNDVAERNRVYFKTEAEAQVAGFRKARNCS